jgi:hypothetical protein
MSRAFVAVVAVLAVTVPMRRAHACTALPGCGGTFAWPAGGTRLPANAPALAITTARIAGLEVGEVTLRPVGGDPIELVRDGDLLRPKTELPRGQALLRWEERCPSSEPMRKDSLFDVVAPAPLPTTLGTLSVTTSVGSVDVVTTDGSCTVAVEAAIADLVVTRSDAARVHGATLAIRTRVDGQLWADTRTPGDPRLGARSTDRIFAVCGERENDRGLRPGRHVVEIEGQVLGESPLPIVRTEVDLRCPRPIDAAGSGCAFGRERIGSAAALVALAAVLLGRRRRG